MAYIEATKKAMTSDFKNKQVADGYSDEAIQAFLDATWSEVLADHIPNEVSERAHILLVSHELFIDKRGEEGGVNAASTKDYSQTNFDWSKGNDPYIVEYRRIAKKFGRGGWRIGFY